MRERFWDGEPERQTDERSGRSKPEDDRYAGTLPIAEARVVYCDEDRAPERRT